jgi:NitT/TauT family transport system substrate-binding protein
MFPSPSVSRRAVLGAGLALPAGAALAACTGGDGPADAGDGPPDKVTYVTNFGQLGRDAYAYLALEHGFFAEANLDVEIEPGGGTNPNLVALLSGRAQFTAIDLAGAIAAYGQTVEDTESGESTLAEGFGALAAIQQQPLAAVMAYDDAGIAHTQDLAGKRVGLPTGAVTQILFETYADLAGVDLSRVEQVEVAASELVTALASGHVDAIGQFIVGRGLVAAAGDGREVVVLPYSEVITDLYGVVLITANGTAESNPDLCVRFRDALLRGLAYSLEHPDEAGQALAEHNEEMPPEVAAGEMTAMKPYAQPGAELGDLDDTRVARGIAVMEANGVSEPGVTPGDVVLWSLTLRPDQ